MTTKHPLHLTTPQVREILAHVATHVETSATHPVDIAIAMSAAVDAAAATLDTMDALGLVGWDR